MLIKCLLYYTKKLRGAILCSFADLEKEISSSNELLQQKLDGKSQKLWRGLSDIKLKCAVRSTRLGTGYESLGLRGYLYVSVFADLHVVRTQGLD